MFVLGVAPRKIGGLEKFLRYLVIALDAAGWDSILCFDGTIAPGFREYISYPFVTIESLDNQKNLGLSCAVELWKLLRKHKPQAFAYGFHGVMRSFPWLAKMAGCRQVIFNDRSSRPLGKKPVSLSLPKGILGRILTAPLTATISNSEFTRRMIDAMGVTSAHSYVVPNGVEVVNLDAGRGERFRKEYGFSKEEIVVTQVCWMVEMKGVITLLDAAALLLRKHAGVRFLLVGDGPELAQYQQYAAALGIGDAVTFTGLLNNPALMGVYDASDIYCQSSLWQEASGFAALEAMSFKLPVVASDTGGLAENIERERSGILVPVGNHEAMYAALDRLICNPALRDSMGEAGYQRILNKHRIEETARSYANLLVN